jgi:RNA polymerase sigma factor
MTAADNTQWAHILEEQWKRYSEGQENALEELPELMDFSLRVASKTCGCFIHRDDEEAGIAQLALWEAIQKYVPHKGTLLLFIGKVVRNRLIDFKRKQTAQRRFLSGEFYPRIQETDLDYQIETIIDDMARSQEIERLYQELQPFGIVFEELPEYSPRQAKTRKEALIAAQRIVEDRELLEFLNNKKMLPLILLENRYGLNRKLLDRYRKYIITTALIISGDFNCLKVYLPLEEGRRGLEA